MAGYNWEAGKSNNALDAEGRGLMNATNTAKAVRRAGFAGVTSAFITNYAPSTGEWHHTSSKFNETRYYDPNDVIEWLQTDWGEKTLIEFKEKKKAVKDKHTTGTVCWVEFSGTGKKTAHHCSYTGELTLRSSRVYFNDRYKSVNGKHIDIVEHPLDAGWTLVRDVDSDVMDRRTWRQMYVLPDQDKCLLSGVDQDNARLLEARDDVDVRVWTDGYFRTTLVEVTEAEQKDVAAREDAARKAEEERQRIAAKKREADREKYPKRVIQRREEKRRTAEQVRQERARWDRIREIDGTVEATVNWGSHEYTGPVTIRNGWVIFDHYPDRTTKLQFHHPNWSSQIVDRRRSTLKVEIHSHEDSHQEDEAA